MPVRMETLARSEMPHSDQHVETPTEKIVREARPLIIVTDTRGRTIRYRAQSILDQTRLMRALGPDLSSNNAYVNLINVAACVVDIDGETGPPKTTVAHLEHRIEWLGDEGFAAIFVEAQKRADALLEETEKASYNDELKNS